MVGGDRLHGADGMVDAILIFAWHLFVFGVGFVLGMITEANCEEENDERIDSIKSKDRSSDR